MTYIKTWKEHLDELPNIQIVTNDDVRGAMLNEIDDLRDALVKSSENVVNIARERNALEASANKWFGIAVQLEKEKYNLIRECTSLKEKITEMNLQYISDFGQLQEREPMPDMEHPGMWESADYLGDSEVFFNKDRVIFAYTNNFKEKMLNHPKVIAEYEKYIKERK